MIENHADSRPQSGLSNADVVYEANSEGGITRLMGIFYCNAVGGVGSNYDVGPVRSARTYFLDLASEYADYPSMPMSAVATAALRLIRSPAGPPVPALPVKSPSFRANS